MITYQLTLKGFDVEDHHVKWVNAPSYHALEAFVNRCKVFDLLDEMPQEIKYRTEDDGVDLVIDADPNRDKYGPVVEGWRAALTAATPEELDALELPFDWHQGGRLRLRYHDRTTARLVQQRRPNTVSGAC